MGTFAAIDFETATGARDSACAVGWVIVEDWKVKDVRSKLIQPPDNDYLDLNIAIHGITPEMTANEPTFDGVWSEVEESIGGRLLVAHNTAFDMSVIRHSAESTNYEIGDFNFACTYRLARDTWKDKFSHSLDTLADDFGIDLDHHDPVSDALASFKIGEEVCMAHYVWGIEDASEELGYRLGVLGHGEYSPFSNAKASSGIKISDLEAEGAIDSESQLFGKRICFTGTFEMMTRAEASQLAVNCGAQATKSVSKNLNYLVVGMTDFSRVKDGMSSKMRKAVELAEAGHDIEIIHEGDFLRMTN